MKNAEQTHAYLHVFFTKKDNMLCRMTTLLI